MGCMNPDLVCPTCFKAAFDVRRLPRKCFKHPKACNSMTASLKQNGLLLAIGFVTGKLGCNLYDIPGLETYSAQSP